MSLALISRWKFFSVAFAEFVASVNALGFQSSKDLGFPCGTAWSRILIALIEHLLQGS